MGGKACLFSCMLHASPQTICRTYYNDPSSGIHAVLLSNMMEPANKHATDPRSPLVFWALKTRGRLHGGFACRILTHQAQVARSAASRLHHGPWQDHCHFAKMVCLSFVHTRPLLLNGRLVSSLANPGFLQLEGTYSQ